MNNPNWITNTAAAIGFGIGEDDVAALTDAISRRANWDASRLAVHISILNAALPTAGPATSLVERALELHMRAAAGQHIEAAEWRSMICAAADPYGDWHRAGSGTHAAEAALLTSRVAAGDPGADNNDTALAATYAGLGASAAAATNAADSIMQAPDGASHAARAAVNREIATAIMAETK